MKDIYFVTGNSDKLREVQELFPASLSLKAKKLELPEIQSLNSEEIIRDKLKRAFEIVQQPVIVEDVAAELAHLNGLPGPFIKYFEQIMGKGALWQMVSHANNHTALVSCTMGYYDGEKQHIVRGEVHGRVVPPRGENGFGFDFVFVPEGETRTFAELSPSEKNRISHRSLAAKEMAGVLSAIR